MLRRIRTRNRRITVLFIDILIYLLYKLRTDNVFYSECPFRYLKPRDKQFISVKHDVIEQNLPEQQSLAAGRYLCIFLLIFCRQYKQNKQHCYQICYQSVYVSHNYKMQTTFHKFIEVAATKPRQATLFIQFAYMEQQIRKSYKQLKDSKGVPKPNEDFIDYWKQIGGGNRQQQVAIYFRWVELLQKAMSTSVHRELQDKQSQLYVKKSMMSKWDIRKVKLNGLDLQVFSKKLKIFPLKCFCIRKSKNKDHFSWVMEVVMQMDYSKFKSFHIGTNNITEFQQWYKEVEMRIELARIQYFRESIGSQAKIIVPSPTKNEERPKIQKTEEIKKEQPAKKQLTHSQEIKLKTKTLTQLFIDNQLKQIQEDNQPLQVIEDNEPLEVHEEEIHPNIFIRIFPDRQIKNFCQNPTNAVLLQCEKQYRLYDLNGTLKIFITMNSSIQIVFRAISQSHSDWNPQINNFSIKNKISSENSALIYEKYKSKGFLYKERDYFFLRHCFTVQNQNQKQKIFMIQKSIDSIHHPPFMTVTRGQKELIWCLVGEKDGKQCLLIVQGLVKGGGYMNIAEDKQATIKKFKMLLLLDNYLKQIQYTKSSKDAYLFKERWMVSFKPEQQQQFYSPRQIQSEQFQNNKIEEMKQQKKNSIDEASQNNENVPKKIKQSQFQEFIKQTTQEHKEKVEENKDKLYAPSVQNFNQEYKPPEFNPDKSVIIPQKFLKKRHQLQPRPKAAENFVQTIRGHHLWKGEWAVSETGGLAYVDQQKMKAQKKVLTFIIKRIGKNILSGKGVLNISLPVDIFCRQSNIERLATSFGYCPLYLQKVANASAMEQLKAVLCSVMGSSLIYLTMQKPFNPILGETYQCWIDGCPVYFQQIAHHPPIAAYLMKGRGYDLYGSVEAKMDLSINSGTGINEGIFTVHFHNGRKFYFTTPPGELVGLTYGDRKLFLVDKTYFWSVEQGIFLEITYNPMAKESRFFGSGRNYVGEQKLQDYFEGAVRKYKPEDLKEFLTPKKNDSRKNMAIPRSLPPQEPVSTHSKVHGRWTKNIYFGEEKIFEVDSCAYLKAYDQKNPLPSHSNYREDVVYRRLNEYVQSQQWKQILQVKQRKDRKMREQFQKKKGK